MPLDPWGKLKRLHAHRSEDHIDPFFFGELFAGFEELRHVHAWKLNGLEILYNPGRAAASFFKEVAHGDDAPDTPRQDLLVSLNLAIGYGDLADSQIGEGHFIDVFGVVERAGYPVDYLEAPGLADFSSGRT